jgi:hypothetical protein
MCKFDWWKRIEKRSNDSNYCRPSGCAVIGPTRKGQAYDLMDAVSSFKWCEDCPVNTQIWWYIESYRNSRTCVKNFLTVSWQRWVSLKLWTATRSCWTLQTVFWFNLLKMIWSPKRWRSRELLSNADWPWCVQGCIVSQIVNCAQSSAEIRWIWNEKYNQRIEKIDAF